MEATNSLDPLQLHADAQWALRERLVPSSPGWMRRRLTPAFDWSATCAAPTPSSFTAAAFRASAARSATSSSAPPASPSSTAGNYNGRRATVRSGQLLVGNRDRADLVEGVLDHAARVRDLLAETPYADVTSMPPSLGAAWGRARSVQLVDGPRVTVWGTGRIAGEAARPGPLSSARSSRSRRSWRASSQPEPFTAAPLSPGRSIEVVLPRLSRTACPRASGLAGSRLRACRSGSSV